MPRGAPPGMAREYDFYMQLHELQPPAPRYHYDISHTNPGAASAYELTVGPGAACEAPLSLHDPRRQQTGGERYEMRCEAQRPAPAPPVATLTSATTKRKSSSFTGSVYEDDGGDDSRSSRTAPDKRQNHSEIEKRRRDKMNTYISELAAMVPMCGAMARKLDKLTVLRMAVQYLRTIKGYLSAGPLTTRPWPAFLTEREQNALILQAAHDCFLLVVGCDRGRVLYLSASVKKMLYYEQNELLGQSLFDILHPKDVAKVKEQLSSSDLSPRDRLIDAKTMLPVKVDMVAGASRLCPGARRSFFCRIKCKAASDSTTVKEDPEPSCKHRKKYSEKKYCVVQCTGYLKSWAPAEISESAVPEGGEESDTCQLSCLVGVGRALPDLTPPTFEPHSVPLQPLQFTSRHATDGKFLFVDQRVTLALGFLPQELLGTSLYEYVNDGELSSLARAHKIALQTREPLHTPTYSFRKKDGSFAWIRTHFKPFRNPWTKDLECLVANNTVIRRNHSSPFPEEPGSYEMFKQSSEYPAEEQEMERLIDTQMESHKIGNAIAEEALRSSSAEFIPELQPKAAFSQQSSLVDDMLSVELGDYDHVRNNVPLSSVGAQSPPPPEIVLPTSPPPVSPPLPPLGLDGNGEAAIAVIMSLLEADAGLGGPINFSGLPWPLP